MTDERWTPRKRLTMLNAYRWQRFAAGVELVRDMPLAELEALAKALGIPEARKAE